MTAENKVKTDSEIIDDVSIAFARSRANETRSWVDYLPAYIECDDSLVDDVDYVGSLADGRAIYYAPHTMDGFLISGVNQ